MSALEQLAADVEGFVDEVLADHVPQHVRAPKVVRDACVGFGRFRPYEWNIIDSPLLQRLRRIHQTALAQLTYPSAVHTRFDHSLGCATLVDRMICALRDRNVIEFTPEQEAHVRLGAILHDCGHVPFSHASEPSVASTELYQAAQAEKPDFFTENRRPHEILSYLIVTSERFRQFWDDIRALYESDEPDSPPKELDMQVVADIILGTGPSDETTYLAHMVNGPIDADKLDYMQRDALFTGLKMQVDLDRLFYTMEPVTLPSTQDKVLAIDLTGVINVEQLAFNKMLLYSSIYHHHKVRAALCYVESLLQSIRHAQCKKAPGDEAIAFDKPSDFLRADDIMLLSENGHSDPTVVDVVQRIKNRRLLKRVLVLSDLCMEEGNRNEYTALIFGHDRGDERIQEKIRTFEQDLASSADVADGLVFFDVPKIPTLDEAGRTTVKRGAAAGEDSGLVTLEYLYPTADWSNAYAQYKHRSYIFGPEEKRADLAHVAVAKIHEHFGIRVNRYALDEAKHDPPIRLEDCHG